MKIKDQVHQFATPEEFLLPLSEDEQVVITGGDGKHKKEPSPKHAKPTCLF